jgi:exopolysaccharide biosynthesis operon protein EpsL
LKRSNIAALLVVVVPVCAATWSARAFAVEIVDARDTLDRAVAGPSYIGGKDEDAFDIYVADRELFDSNVYRLPNGTDVAALIGPSAAKQDHINSPSAGLDSQWVTGRQSIAVQLHVDDNRFAQNTDLDNVSSTDSLVWNWGLGGVLSGQLGADYLRALASFINTNIYSRNVYQRTEVFAAARYQLGPRWAIYGGLLNTNFSLAESATKGNDSHQKSGDLGVEFATNVEDSFALDYRYTDARYPNAIVLNAAAFDPDYREDRLSLLMKRALSDKTSIDLSAGYLKRDYASTAIDSFKGVIWRGSLGWQPTDKTQLIVSVYRNLQAYLTDQTNYYRATGASISPVWTATEKVSFSFLASREEQSYIGSSTVAPNVTARRDTATAEQAAITYTATRSLSFDATYRHEQRESNQQLRSYTDELASVGVRFQF